MPTEPYDEVEIGPEDAVIRRIDPKYHVVWDENRGCHRISSGAYRESSGLNGGMSVDIEKLITAAGLAPHAFVTTPVFTGSVCFPANAIRALDFQIGYDPIVDVPNVADNPFHGEVWTKQPTKKFSASQKAGLAKLAKWYVQLSDVEIC